MSKLEKFVKDNPLTAKNIGADLAVAEIADLRAKLAARERVVIEATAILIRVGEYGPPEGIIQKGIACAFCDMGGAGYATRGDGYHDDKCAVKDAQLFVIGTDSGTPSDKGEE